jgi:hypothetical protein
MGWLFVVITELREVFINGNKLLEMAALLDCGDKSKLLKVLLEDLLSLINKASTSSCN